MMSWLSRVSLRGVLRRKKRKKKQLMGKICLGVYSRASDSVYSRGIGSVYSRDIGSVYSRGRGFVGVVVGVGWLM